MGVSTTKSQRFFPPPFSGSETTTYPLETRFEESQWHTLCLCFCGFKTRLRIQETIPDRCSPTYNGGPIAGLNYKRLDGQAQRRVTVGQRFLSKCVQAHHDTTIVLWCTYTHQFLSLDETKTWTDCWVLSRNLLFPTIPSFRWGWVFLEQMWILSWIQFTTHSIEIVVVETKQFVGSFENAILTQQTCGQRSNRVAESKCRSLGNDFSEWICYVFLMSKCRGDWDLGLYTTSVLAFGEPQRNGKIRGKNVFRRRKNQILPLRCGSPNSSTEVVHRPRSQSPLNFDIRNI